ncbi:hypothetical protein JCM5296_006277 [Sporobolomyces johnsonii]
MSNNPYHQSTASVPQEPPPAYSHAPQDASGHLLPTLAASSSTPGAPPLSHRRSSSGASSHTYSSFEDEDESGIPTDERRSMDDAMRPLPEGWRREFDPATEHFFYVDVTANPPRSIWTHPYDPEYLSHNPSDKSHSRVYAPPPGPPPSQSHPHSHSSPTSPTPDKKPTPTTGGAGHPKDKDKDDRTFGRKMKDKLTGTTHEQRVEQRRRQAELERKQYEAYLARRRQLLEAQRNGTYAPMYAAPSGPFGRPAYGYGNGYGGGGYGRGYGYGGGMGGMGTGMALGGGLLGGLLIGDLLF